MSDQEAMVPSLRGPIERVVLVGEQGGVHEKSWESACADWWPGSDSSAC